MAKVQGPEAVPGVGIASDPGVNASPAAFGAQVGQALQGFANELSGIASTAADLQKRRQSLADATLINTADIEHGNKLWETQTAIEDEAGDDAVTQFIDRSTGLGDEALTAAQEKHGMTLSKEGRQRWEIRAAQSRNSFARQTSISAHNRQMTKAQIEAKDQIMALDAFVYQNPGEWETAVQKAQDIRENLVGAGFGSFYVDQWIGNEKAVKERFFKTHQAALTDANNPQNDPNAARENLMPANSLGQISTVGAWLGEAESGGRAKTNRLGYAGVHQMGAPRLAELRLYRPGEKENLKTWSKTDYKRAAGKRPDGSTIWEVIPGTGKWTGQVLIPGMQPMTVDEFMMNPKAQMVAWRVHEQDIINKVRGSGLDQYIGQTINGVPITMNGMIAGAHIGGFGGMKNFILNGADQADENGTAISTYMKRAAKIEDGQVNAVFAGMSPADQALMYQQAQAAFARDQSGAEAALQAQQAQYNRMWQSNVASIQDTGTTQPWDTEAAAKVYGWDKVTEQQAKETRAYARYAATAPLNTMSDRDAEQHVIGLYTAAGTRQGTTGYLDAKDAADFARSKLEEIRRLRTLAPAEAALKFPEVREAYRNVVEHPNDPTAMQSYIGKSIRVQQGFALPQPSTSDDVDELIKATLPAQHLPDAILKEIAKDFEDLPVANTREEKVEQKEMLREHYNRMKSLFGKYTDEIILEAYQYMDRNDGTDKVVIESVKQIVRSNGAPRAVTVQARAEEDSRLKQLIKFLSENMTFNALDPFGVHTGIMRDITGLGAEEPAGEAGDVTDERLAEPSGDPLQVPMTNDKMLELAKEYAKRGEEGEDWLDEQDYLSETQKKMVRARGGGGR